MSATPTPATPQLELSHGAAIEYKAYARSFFQNDPAGVLYLMATCYYPTNGFTISFEPDGTDRFKLVEQPPTGVFLNLVTYVVATHPATGISAQSAVPKHVTIVDAQGEHRVHVRPWD
jgi:hypothetical protein